MATTSARARSPPSSPSPTHSCTYAVLVPDTLVCCYNVLVHVHTCRFQSLLFVASCCHGVSLLQRRSQAEVLLGSQRDTDTCLQEDGGRVHQALRRRRARQLRVAALSLRQHTTGAAQPAGAPHRFSPQVCHTDDCLVPIYCILCSLSRCCRFAPLPLLLREYQKI